MSNSSFASDSLDLKRAEDSIGSAVESGLLDLKRPPVDLKFLFAQFIFEDIKQLISQMKGENCDFQFNFKIGNEYVENSDMSIVKFEDFDLVLRANQYKENNDIYVVLTLFQFFAYYFASFFSLPNLPLSFLRYDKFKWLRKNFANKMQH